MASEAIVARLKAVLSGDSSQLRADLGKAERSLKKFGDNATKTGRSLTTKVTLPMVGLGAAAVKTAADFESSMTKITALVGVAKDEVDTMSVAVRSMATQFGKSANEAADALFYITSAGLRGSTATDTLAASLKASAIGLGDTATIADLATSALNAYGADVLSASQATDVMTATIREGKLETTELAGSMGRVLPLASAMGVNFNEVGAAFAALSRTGTNAAEAATQIRGILSSLLRPTKQAEEALTEMGLSSEGLRRQMREEGLLATLKRLSEEFAGNEAAAASVFGNIRALSGVLDLMGANVATTEAIFASMTDTTGAVDEAFDAVSQTAAFQFQQAMAEMKETLLALGQDLLPLVKDALELVSDSIRGVTDFFRGMDEDTQHAVKALAGVVAIAGPVALGVGMISKALLALKATNPWILGITAALTGLGVILGDHMAEAREAKERQDDLTEAFQRANDPAFGLVERFEELTGAIAAYKQEMAGAGDETEAFIGQAELQGALLAEGLLGPITEAGIDLSNLSAEAFAGFEGFTDRNFLQKTLGFLGNVYKGSDAAMDIGAQSARDFLEAITDAGGASAHAARMMLHLADSGQISERQLESLTEVVSKHSDAYGDAMSANEQAVKDFLETGEPLAAFLDTPLYGRAVKVLGQFEEGKLSAVEAQQQLNRILEVEAVQLAENEARMAAYNRAQEDVADSTVLAASSQDAFIMALAEAEAFIGHDISRVQELVHELGILDGLSTETKVAIGLEFEGLDNVRAQLRAVIDTMLAIDRIPLALAEKSPKFSQALEALRALDKIASGQEAPGFAGGGDSPASTTVDEIGRAAEQAARDLERLTERVDDMGKVLGDEDFFEFLLGATADQIEDRFDDIAEAAMELVEQAEALGVPGGPEFLQALAAIGDQFDRLAAVQSQIASTQDEIATAESRLAAATNDLASAQANLNRENERYAAFLYGEGAGGGTFEQVLQTEIDVYRDLQRELAGLESAQSGFRQRIVDMMSPTVAGAAGAGGVMGNLGNILTQARSFRNNLIELRDRGFPTDVIGQVVAAGMTNGNVISRRLLALGTAEFEEFLALRDEIGRIGVETAAIAGEVIFGADIAEAQGAVGAQFAVVDAMFQSAIAQAAANVREQAAVVERLRGALRALQDRLTGLQDQVTVLAGGIQAALTAAFDQFLAGFNDSITRIAQVADVPAPPPAPAPATVSRPASAPDRIATPTQPPVLAPAPTPSRPTVSGGGGGGPVRMMARGGRVGAGQPYLVGEMGPELFVPSQSGSIVSNGQTQAMAAKGAVYNISVNAYGDPAEAGRQIVKAIQEWERRNGSNWRA